MGKRSILFYMAEEDERAFLTWLLQVPYLALYWGEFFRGSIKNMVIRKVEDFYQASEQGWRSEVIIRDLRFNAEFEIGEVIEGQYQGWNFVKRSKLPGLWWIRSKRTHEDSLEVIKQGSIEIGYVPDYPPLSFSEGQLIALLHEIRLACFKNYTKYTFIPRWSVWIGPEARRLAELGQAGLEVPGGQGEQRWIKLKS